MTALFRILLAALPAVFALAVPAGALGAPTTTLTSERMLIVEGEAADETLKIVQQSPYVSVTDPPGMNDPDGAGLACFAFDSGATASCLDAVIVNGAAGDDKLEGRRTSTTDVDRLDGGAGNDGLLALDTGSCVCRLTLVGGEGDDRLTRNRPSTSPLELFGGPGDDRLDAGFGQLGPTDYGDGGDDTFNGSPQGGDRFAAEAGADTYNGGTRTPVPGEVVDDPATYQHRMAQDVMSYEDTITPVRVSMDGNTGDGVAGEDDNVMPDIERLVGGAAGDDISAGLERAELAGGPGNDRLSGGPGADGLEGDGGNDLLFGNGGDDSLDDGDGTPAVVDPTLPPPGNDRLDGGPGRDFLQSDRGADELIGGAGTDVTAFIRWIPQPPTAPPPPQFAAFVVSLDGLPNDGQRGAFEGDNVHGDIEEIFTGDAADLLIGSPGPDLLGGAGGDDRIEPGPGADSVNAGDGNDAVAAIDGTTDRVDCGRGNDVAEADLPGQPGGSFDVTFDCEAVTGGPSGPPSLGADRIPPRISGFRVRQRARRRPSRQPLRTPVPEADRSAAISRPSNARREP